MQRRGHKGGQTMTQRVSQGRNMQSRSHLTRPVSSMSRAHSIGSELDRREPSLHLDVLDPSPSCAALPPKAVEPDLFDEFDELNVFAASNGSTPAQSEPESSADDDDEEEHKISQRGSPREEQSDEEEEDKIVSKTRRPVVLDGVVDVVRFNYPKVVNEVRAGTSRETPPGLSLRFKISSSVWQYNAVVNSLRWAGLQPTAKTALANVYWGRHLPAGVYGKLIGSFQKLNHFPGTWCIGRKDRLALNMRRALERHGRAEFSFVPLTFVLPADRASLDRVSAAKPQSVWIQKPYSSSCGKGIKLVHNPSRIGKKTKCILSRYIHRPMLIDGFKFDLRLYCVVTCMDPLRIYTLDDGLVRFATERFHLTKSSLNHRRMHLTNYSVNKGSKEFVKNASASESDTGSKWSLQALRQYFVQHSIDADVVFDRINDLMVKTIITAESSVFTKCARLGVGRTNCFELFGIDVLLDSKLRPWLLEVNILPSLSSSSPLDKLIKTKLMSDIFNIIGVLAVDAKTASRRSNCKYQQSTSNRSAAGIKMVSLTPCDIEILREVEEEYRRRGHLQRIFPVRNQSYAKFFESQRYNNVLVEKWLALPRKTALRLIGYKD